MYTVTDAAFVAWPSNETPWLTIIHARNENILIVFFACVKIIQPFKMFGLMDIYHDIQLIRTQIPEKYELKDIEGHNS